MRRRSKQIFGVSCAMLLVSLAVVARKFYLYAAAPTQPKDCNYIFPQSTDQTKPTTITLTADQLSVGLFNQFGGTINDASCLNQTTVYGIVDVQSTDDISTALQFARDHDLSITAAGQRHSMGGQAFNQQGVVLDMRNYNEVTINKADRVMHVQAGATWQQIQAQLDAEGLAVQAMQSINIFTVGGTLSVNAHGIAHQPGQVASTVQAMHIMLPDGTIVTASPTENADLFKHVLGGYGLFGIILDADLSVVDNELYALTTEYMDYHDFPSYYQNQVAGNDQLGLFYARLSVSPNSYLTETAVHAYTKTSYDQSLPTIQPQQHTWFMRWVINFSKTGKVGRWLRWTLEKYLQPRVRTCVTRNTAMSQAGECLVSRNQEMSDSMQYLKNRLPDTDILQEYFIPLDQMPQFVDGLRSIVETNQANLLNVTIRIVHQDTITALPYAPEDRFAFVLYFNQGLNEADSQVLKQTTTELIDLATSLQGSFYLPYQLYYSNEQLQTAYPNINDWFAAKRQYDPTGLLTNTWYQQYGQPVTLQGD